MCYHSRYGTIVCLFVCFYLLNRQLPPCSNHNPCLPIMAPCNLGTLGHHIASSPGVVLSHVLTNDCVTSPLVGLYTLTNDCVTSPLVGLYPDAGLGINSQTDYMNAYIKSMLRPLAHSCYQLF